MKRGDREIRLVDLDEKEITILREKFWSVLKHDFLKASYILIIFFGILTGILSNSLLVSILVVLVVLGKFSKREIIKVFSTGFALFKKQKIVGTATLIDKGDKEDEILKEIYIRIELDKERMIALDNIKFKRAFQKLKISSTFYVEITKYGNILLRVEK